MGSSTRIAVASRVTAGIRNFENSLDETLIGGTEFIATMLRARQDAKLAAAVGHEALEEILTACNHAFQARSAIMRSHDRLDHLRKELKLPEIADGGKTTPPNPSGVIDTVPATMSMAAS